MPSTAVLAFGLAFATVAGVAFLSAERPDTPEQICAFDYARSHRMSASESHRIKLAKLQEWNLANRAARGSQDFELDHIVPLCLGGTNSLSNLQLQPIEAAQLKDKKEVEVCKAMCRGDISLDAARGLFRREFTP